MSIWFALTTHIDKLAPGVICAAVVAIAAMFLSEHYGASAMLFYHRNGGISGDRGCHGL